MSWFSLKGQKVSEEGKLQNSSTSSWAYSLTLKVEALRSFKILVNFYWTTQHSIPEDSTFHIHCYKNIKSKALMKLFILFSVHFLSRPFQACSNSSCEFKCSLHKPSRSSVVLCLKLSLLVLLLQRTLCRTSSVLGIVSGKAISLSFC